MRYRTIELGVPGKAKCPDEYNEASTLFCPGSTRLFLQVSKQSVRIQYGIMPHPGSALGSIEWQEEGEHGIMPVIGSFGRSFDAVRFKNYTPGQEAQVILSVD